MKYSKRKDKYCCNVLNDNFQEIDERLKDLEENSGSGGGAAGKDGVSVVSVEQTTTSTEDGGINVVTCTLSDGKTSGFEIRNGGKGSPGEPGSPGAPGEDGATPTIGDNENWFIDGTDTGKPSRGVKGDTGEKGEQGPQGIQGPVGEQGPKGDTGERGPQGEQGIQGVQGKQGAQGVPGSQWYYGTAIVGATVVDAAFENSGVELARINDKYLNTETSEVFDCTKGGDSNTATWTYIGKLSAKSSYTDKTLTLVDAPADSAAVGERFTVSRLTNEPGEWYDSGGKTIKTAFGNGLFVDINGRYSYDGKNWFNGDLPEYSVNTICYEFIEFGNGRFIIIKPINDSACGIWYSTNGINWTEADTVLDGVADSTMYIHNSWSHDYLFTYTKGMFILVHYPYSTSLNLSRTFRSYVSNDGINWTSGTEYTVSITPSTNNSTISGVGLSLNNFEASNGIAFFTGSMYVAYYDNNNEMIKEDIFFSYYTSNGKTWSKSNLSKAVSCAMAGNGKYVMIDSDTDAIYHSTDAKSWTTVATYKVGDVSGTTFADEHYNIRSCVCLNNEYYIVVQKNTSIYIWVSTDLTTWTIPRNMGHSAPIAANTPNKLLYGNGVYKLGRCLAHNKMSTDSMYLDSLGGKMGANPSGDHNPLSFVPFSDVSVSKGSLTVATTSDPATFIPLEFDSMYLLLTTEVTISTGAQYGRHVQAIHTSVSPTTGIGVIGRDAIKSSTNSGVTITNIVREDAFGFTIKPSGVAYRVDYVLIKVY